MEFVHVSGCSIHDLHNAFKRALVDDLSDKAFMTQSIKLGAGGRQLLAGRFAFHLA